MIYLIFFLKTVNKRVFFGSSIYRNWSVFSMITTFIFCYFLDFFFFFFKEIGCSLYFLTIPSKCGVFSVGRKCQGFSYET